MGQQRNNRKRRVPLGAPLPDSTDQDAEITPEDIERAKINWRKNAPPQYRDLLDAEVDSGEEFK